MESQLFQTETIQTLKYIVRQIQWDSFRRAPWWFLSIHVPYMLRCIWSARTNPMWKNPYWNSRVYDGLTRNDFKKGEFVSFLYKLRIIEKFDYEDDDGRGYFIGYQNDD